MNLPLGNPTTNLFDIALCLSEAMDLVNSQLVDHHKRVAYIASVIAAEMGLSEPEQNETLLAGLLHDSGALSAKERVALHKFESKDPFQHTEFGYRLYKNIDFLSNTAEMIRFHHMRWNNGSGNEINGKPIPLGAHILHLADRISVLLKDQILGSSNAVIARIKEKTGNYFMPDAADAFFSLARKESFWLEATIPSIGSVLSAKWEHSSDCSMNIDLDKLSQFMKVFGQIIDFRSPFTATHSSGVAAVATKTASFFDFSEERLRMMLAAGYLHDLGKLAVPASILEKPAKLKADEFSVMKSHAFFTYHVLRNVPQLETINTWGALHHENLDGNGYPFRKKGEEIPLGSRIMAVADVFTALTEDRPYRKGMSQEQASEILTKLSSPSHMKLDPDIVAMVMANREEVNAARVGAQETARLNYQDFYNRRPENWLRTALTFNPFAK